jgi:hypothetical protein
VISTDPDTAKQVGEVVQQRLMRKHAVTPEVEASLCVENSRHRLADILEEKQVNALFCDENHQHQHQPTAKSSASSAVSTTRLGERETLAAEQLGKLLLQ